MNTRQTHHTIITLFAALLLPALATAQSVVDDYVEMGLENNQEYLRQQISTQIADEEARIAQSLFFPDVQFQASYLLADGGRMINVPAGDLINPTNRAINQLAENSALPTDIQNVNEQFLASNFHETKISVVQPILNTDIYYGYKARQAQVNVSRAKEQAYQNQLAYEIRKAYYNYAKLVEQKTILDSTRLVVEELVRVNKKFIKYDVATPDVLYNAEAQLYQIDADRATVTKQLNQAHDFFNFLLNRDLAEPIEVSALTPSDLPTYDTGTLQEAALAQRSEIDQIRNGMAAQDFEIKRSKGYLIPDISVAGQLGYQGFGYEFGDDQQYSLASFNLSWPISQGGGNKARVQKARLARRQLATEFSEIKNRIRLEVTSATYEYREAVAVHRARLSELQLARENFGIIAAKYRENQVLLVEFNEARSNLTTAQLSESIARYNIKITQANINRVIQY